MFLLGGGCLFTVCEDSRKTMNRWLETVPEVERARDDVFRSIPRHAPPMAL